MYGTQPRQAWVWDLETAISPEGKKYLESVDHGYNRTFKVPEKVEESKKEYKEAALAKAPLYWWYGKIVAAALYDFEKDQMMSWKGDDERLIIQSFFRHIRDNSIDNLNILIGKNSSTFDEGYMIGRCMANRLGVPSFMRRNFQISDIDQIFAMKGGNQAASIGKLSEYGFGLTGAHKATTGADVAGMVERGEWDKLESYNRDDVWLTAMVYREYMREFVYE